jgi:hypothetical protein
MKREQNFKTFFSCFSIGENPKVEERRKEKSIFTVAAHNNKNKVHHHLCLVLIVDVFL